MKDLVDLYQAFLSRTAIISDCFRQAHSKQYGLYVQEMCVIRLYDLWERFCKELIFLSAYGKPISISGKHIPRIAGVHKRSPVLVRLQGIRRVAFRPAHLINWGNPTISIMIAQELGVSNFQNISLSLGGKSLPIEDLRAIRNYLAHRNENTARGVQQVTTTNSFGVRCDPLVMLNSLRTPGVSLFDLWITQIRIIARNAADY